MGVGPPGTIAITLALLSSLVSWYSFCSVMGTALIGAVAMSGPMALTAADAVPS